MGAKGLTHTGIQSPDRPARNRTLYRLNYRNPHVLVNLTLITITLLLSYTLKCGLLECDAVYFQLRLQKYAHHVPKDRNLNETSDLVCRCLFIVE